MSLKQNVEYGDEIVLVHLSGDLGILRGIAGSDKESRAGGSAYMPVTLYENQIRGVYSMEINLNSWDVYVIDNPSLPEVLLDTFLPKPY